MRAKASNRAKKKITTNLMNEKREKYKNKLHDVLISITKFTNLYKYKDNYLLF